MKTENRIELAKGVDPALAERIQSFFANTQPKAGQAPDVKPHGKPGKDGFSYKYYLRTALWQLIRARVMARDNETCLRCDGKADEVHHKSYDHIVLCGGNDNELVCLCSGCHHSVEFRLPSIKNTREAQIATLAEKDKRRDYPEPNIDLRRSNQKLPANWNTMNYWQRDGWTRRHDELLYCVGTMRRVRKPTRWTPRMA